MYVKIDVTIELQHRCQGIISVLITLMFQTQKDCYLPNQTNLCYYGD